MEYNKNRMESTQSLQDHLMMLETKLLKPEIRKSEHALNGLIH